MLNTLSCIGRHVNVCIKKHELCVDLNRSFLQKNQMIYGLNNSRSSDFVWAAIVCLALDTVWAHAHAFTSSKKFQAHETTVECHKMGLLWGRIYSLSWKTAANINHLIIIIITNTCSIQHSFFLRWLIMLFVLWAKRIHINAHTDERKIVYLSTYSKWLNMLCLHELWLLCRVDFFCCCFETNCRKATVLACVLMRFCKWEALNTISSLSLIDNVCIEWWLFIIEFIDVTDFILSRINEWMNIKIILFLIEIRSAHNELWERVPTGLMASNE